MEVLSDKLAMQKQLNPGNVCTVIADSSVGGDTVTRGEKVLLIKLPVGSRDIWLCSYYPPVKGEDNFCVEAKNLERY